MAKPGRKRIEINWEEFEGLCAIQATLEEMAIVLGCSERTIERAVQRHYKMNFVSLFAQKRKRGHISIRRRIWTAALNGSVPLLIFLAKQYLGMADQVEVRWPGQRALNEPDLSRLTDGQLAVQRILATIREGLVEPALGAKQLAAALAQLPEETPGPTSKGGSTGADTSPDRRSEGEETPPPVRPVN